VECVKRPLLRAVIPLCTIAAMLFSGLISPGTAFGKPSGEPDSESRVSPAGLPAKFKSWDELFTVQRALDDAASRIEAAADKSPDSGFTSLRVDPETNSLTVYWRGDPAGAEVAVLDVVRSSGINVQRLPAKYSRKQLDQKVALIEKDAVRVGNWRISQITKRPDGAGVEVGVVPVGGSGADRSPSGPWADEKLPNLQSAIRAGDVFIVETRTEARPMFRENDSPSGNGHFGGSLIRGPGVCSSGFAVHWPGVGDYMTTAAHCGGVGSAWFNGAGEFMGYMTNGNIGYDLRFIQTPSAGRIWSGPQIYRPGQYHVPVRRASHTHIGDWLCISGSFTGIRCSVRASGPTSHCGVDAIGLGPCFNVEGGISSVHELIMGEGDSGGPVFLPINGFNQPNSAADARGLVSSSPERSRESGWGPYPCFDPLSGGVRNCFTALWFTDILSAIQPWAASGMFVQTE
jgi:hypothetical protein